MTRDFLPSFEAIIKSILIKGKQALKVTSIFQIVIIKWDDPVTAVRRQRPTFCGKWPLTNDLINFRRPSL